MQRQGRPEKTILRLAMPVVGLAVMAQISWAQQPDSTARADSAMRADSTARRDSLVRRELERIRGEARPVAAMGGDAGGETSTPSADLLSSLVVIGDLIADLSPDGSTLASNRRFELRDIHVGLGAPIASRLRGDFMIGVDDQGNFMLMEAALSAGALPGGFEARAGRFQAPFGVQNPVHRVYLPTIDYPYVIQRFFGAHGGRATGVSLAHSAAWLGIRSRLVVAALESFPEGHDLGGEHAALGHLTFEPVPVEPANKTLQGLGYTARLSATWHFERPFSVEGSVSGGTGRSTQPFGCEALGHYEPCPAGRGETGVNARQSLVGAGLSIRWQRRDPRRPRSAIFQAEVMRQQNALPRLPRGAPAAATYLGPTADPIGGYALARAQLSRRIYAAGRYDWVEAAIPSERTTVAKSAYLQWVPSELSRLTLMFEQAQLGVGEPLDRVLLQMKIGIGARGSHAH